MESNIDLKALWKGQAVPEANMETLMKRVTALRASKRKNILIVNLTLIPTMLFIAWIWFYYEPQYLTTKIGIVLTIGAIVISLITHNKLIPLYKTLNSDQFNSDYLKNLLLVQKREFFIQTKIISLYFLMLSVGIGLYMYEYASRMSVTGFAATYVITALWMVFNWFYIRPKQIRKSQQKLNEVITQLEHVCRQLRDA